jgi:hypothetical protein
VRPRRPSDGETAHRFASPTPSLHAEAAWEKGTWSPRSRQRVECMQVLSADCMRSPIECGNDWKQGRGCDGCCPVECVSRRWYSEAMVPSKGLRCRLHRGPPSTAMLRRLTVWDGCDSPCFAAQACDDDALAVREWCRFLRCPACEIPRMRASAARRRFSAGTPVISSHQTSPHHPSASSCQCS